MSNAYWDLIDRRGRPPVPRELAEWQALEYPGEFVGWLLRGRDTPRPERKKSAGDVVHRSPSSATSAKGRMEVWVEDHGTCTDREKHRVEDEFPSPSVP